MLFIFKNLEIITIFVEKDINFFLEYNNNWPFFLNIPAFVQYFANVTIVIKKKGCKWAAIVLIGSSYIKIVFILLVKLIVI